MWFRELQEKWRLASDKQSDRCHNCGRQFVKAFEQRRICDDKCGLVKWLLCERLSLQGICRVVGVGMTGLMGFIVQCYEVPLRI